MKKIVTMICAFIISICGMILVGCNEDYDSLSLSFSAPRIELTLGEDEFYVVKINNYFIFEANFSFDFDTECAKIKKVEDFQKGEYRIQVSPLVAGSTSLKITLLEGKKTLTVPVIVGEKVEEISLKNADLFVIRGESLNITKDMFRFEPLNTLQKDVKISITQTNQTTGTIETKLLKNGVLDTSETAGLIDENQTSIDLIATSAFNEEITASFTVQIVEKIDLTSTKLAYLNNDSQSILPFNDTNANNYGIIELITNNNVNYCVDLKLIQDNVHNYIYDITSENSILNIEYSTSNVVGQTNFNIQKNTNCKVNETYLLINVRHSNYEAYFETIRYKVSIKQAPQYIRVNNQLESMQYDLFTNGESQNVSLFVLPEACEYENISLNFYTYSTIDATWTRKEYSEIQASIKVKVDGYDITSTIFTKDQIANTIFAVEATNNNVEKLKIEFVAYSENNYYLTQDTSFDISLNKTYYQKNWVKVENIIVGETNVYGYYEKITSESTINYVKITNKNTKALNNNEYYRLDFTTVTNPTIVSGLYEYNKVVNNIMFTIKQGATEFGLDTEKYINKTIIVENGSTVTFNDFKFSENASVGTMSIYQTSGTEGCVNVSQENSDITPTIKIASNYVGTATYVLMLGNKLSTTITIKVVEPFDLQNLSIAVDSVSNDSIASIKYKDIHITGQEDDITTLESLALRYVPGKNTVVRVNVITGASSVEMYNIQFTSTNTKIKIVKESENSFVITVSGEIVNKTEIAVEMSYFTVENFNKNSEATDINISNGKSFNWKLESYTPISSLSLTAKNKGQSSQYSTYIDVYNQNMVGFVDKNLSVIDFERKIDKEIINQDDDNNKYLSWMFSCKQEIKDLSAPHLITLLNNNNKELGVFNTNDLTFTCESTSNLEIIDTTFQIIAKYTKYTQTMISAVNISIKEYISVDKVLLRNYTQSIYLDSVTTEYEIYPYFTAPNNAQPTNTGFVALFKPNTGVNRSIVLVDYDSTKIIVRYSGNGGGSGYINIIPTAWIKDSLGNYDNYLSIPVNVADGTEENPIHIRTLEQFKNINNASALSKHYVIDSTIDANGASISPLGVLTGSITGANAVVSEDGTVIANNVGSIINFVIETGTIEGKYGLFTQISDSAIVSNLVIQGSFDINSTLATGITVGILCAENYGLIKNVTATITNSSIVSESSVICNIGGLVGVNEGYIVTDMVERRVGEDSTSQIGSPIETNGNIWLMNNYVPEDSLMVYMLNNEKIDISLINSDNNYVGGIAGNNKGKILCRKSNDFRFYNNYGTNAVVYINLINEIVGEGDSATTVYTNAKLGAVCGTNSGTVQGLLIKGELNGNSYVAGVSGEQTAGVINNITSRVFVRGTNNVAGLVGALSEGSVTNSTIEAIDDGVRVGIKASLITKTENSNNIFIGNKEDNLYTSNSANTYFTRIMPYEDGQNTTNAVLDNIDKYYGDIININSDNSINKLATFVTKETAKLSDIYTGIKPVVMMNIAKNANEQIYLKESNNIEMPNVWADGNIPEITISSLNSSIITVASNGKLNLLAKGTARLKIVNSLNARDVIIITVYVTSYVNKLEIYATQDFSGEPFSDSNYVSILNDNIVQVYPRYVAGSFTTLGNTIIKLAENDELITEVVSDDESIKVEYLGNNIYLKGGNLDGQATVSFKISYTKDQTTMYFGNEEFGSLENATSYDVKAEYARGIYEINLDKTNMNIVPSDVINLSVNYSSYNAELKPVLSVYIKPLKLQLTNEEDINDYFNIEVSTPVNLSENRYCINYKISLKTESNIILGNYEFIFGTEDEKVKSVLKVNYITQPINNVTVKNYSYADNEKDIYNTSNKCYNASFTMIESNNVTAGKSNLLRVGVAPWYSNYEYFEITNDSSNYNGMAIAQFTLLNIDGTTASTTSDGYYLTNGIRVLKSSLPARSENILILYKIPTNVSSGEILRINISFYDKDGNLVYDTIQKQLTVVISNEIDINILDANGDIKQYEYENEIKVYRVARGYNYLLNVKITGYEPENVNVFTTSQYAAITQSNGVYLLAISKQINYPEGSAEGLEFTITYYGKRYVEGKLFEDSRKTIKCVIVEYVVETDIMALFSQTSSITLTVGKKTDLRRLLINNIQIEYADCAQSSVDALKVNLYDYANYYYRSSINNDFTIIGAAQIFVESNGLFKIDSVYVITALKILDNPEYQFGIYANLIYNQGKIIVDTSMSVDAITSNDIKEFSVVTVQQTSNESPWPIYNYNDFIKIAEGGYYILLGDIDLPTDFVPLNINVASLDGNGYTINYPTTNIQLENVNSYGLFDTISAFENVDGIKVNPIIKNLTISVRGASSSKETTFNLENTNNSTALMFGLLCANNDGGIITNCAIDIQGTSSLKIKNYATISNSNSSYVGLLVGQNEGYISNCRVLCKADITGANIGGLVGINKGTITSCFVKDSIINNSSTNANNTTGGLVTMNSGVIRTSYIAGSINSSSLTKMYCSNTNYILRSSAIVGGFIYNNNGIIENCYSNIPIVSSSKNAGFVAINNGKISNSYASCMLGSADTENYPFFISKTESSLFENCYYLKDTSVNNNTSNTNYNILGLKQTTLEDFANPDTFSNFAFNNDNLQSGYEHDESQGVWFFPKDNTKENLASFNGKYVNSYTYTVASLPDGDGLVDEIGCKSSQQFLARRPELVSANYLAYSRKEIIRELTEINEVTGETIYYYTDSNINYEEGTKNNPILISSATVMENVIESCNSIGSQSLYYRIICDIDYITEKISNSNLYKTVFGGYLEGNGFKIANYSLNNSSKLLSAGLFAQVGSGFIANRATVQNLVLSPKYINLPNAYHVGSLCGIALKCNIYNINVEQPERTEVIVLGRNVVGGVIGLTKLGVDINNLTSGVSVNAYYSEDYKFDRVTFASDIFYNQITGDYLNISYAGSVIGIVGSASLVKNVYHNTDTVSIGMIAGLLFGGISESAIVSNVKATISHSEKSYVRASAFASLIVGDLCGQLNNVTLENIEATNEQLNNKVLKCEPISPIAVGSIVGVMRNGQLNTVDSNVSVDCKKANYVGGVIGLIISTSNNDRILINNVRYGNETSEGKVCDIVGRQKIGGLVGFILDFTPDRSATSALGKFKVDKVHLNKINLHIIENIGYDSDLSDNDKIDIYIGSFIGEYSQQDNNIELTLLNCLQDNVKFKVDAITYSRSLDIYCGSIYGYGSLNFEEIDSSLFNNIKTDPDSVGDENVEPNLTAINTDSKTTKVNGTEYTKS